MAVHKGNIVGTAANGSLYTKSRLATYFSIGYNFDELPSVYDGREMSYSVGELTSMSHNVDIYRWGTWRELDTHGDDLVGYITDKYQYGKRVKEGQSISLNLMPMEHILSSVNGVGLIRESIRGIRVKESYAGNESVIKILIPKHQDNLIGKTWGNWTDGGSGGTAITHLRPRRYPDTHIPRRREDT
ncbi:hypothetical protein P4V86_03395 [Brevibacillus laterosporus]|uniref:hypothetical protein n=1 Tax=Brevibacillus laterosporus TaxID=1465 RepID=UPI00036FAA56|nr:hypothetical protein [Brevibacillus laterosporus]ATO48567.1 hypothetical protein BrL25_05225 [Brevibacillus laterosporus DSM 25]MED2002403.1 hypothetical protein [Brevibacillus laterosporus]